MNLIEPTARSLELSWLDLGWLAVSCRSVLVPSDSSGLSLGWVQNRPVDSPINDISSTIGKISKNCKIFDKRNEVWLQSNIVKQNQTEFGKYSYIPHNIHNFTRIVHKVTQNFRWCIYYRVGLTKCLITKIIKSGQC